VCGEQLRAQEISVQKNITDVHADISVGRRGALIKEQLIPRHTHTHTRWGRTADSWPTQNPCAGNTHREDTLSLSRYKNSVWFPTLKLFNPIKPAVLHVIHTFLKPFPHAENPVTHNIYSVVNI